MTVSSIIPVNNYYGNGSNKIFDFDFLIEKPEELVVTLISHDSLATELKYGIDYSINEIGNENGSYIVFPLEQSNYNILGNDETITLVLNLEIKQESKFYNSANLNLKVLEWTFDYIIRIIQMLSRKIDRAIKIREGKSQTPDELLDSINESQKKTYENTLLSEKLANSASEAANIATLKAQLASDKAQECTTLLDNKLDTDVANLSNIGINKINTLDEPDFTKCTKKAFNTQYTAEEDGWIFSAVTLQASSVNGVVSVVDVGTKINNVEVFHIKCQIISTSNVSVASAEQGVNLSRIYKGQTYKMSTLYSSGNSEILEGWMMFYPLKGAD